MAYRRRGPTTTNTKVWQWPLNRDNVASATVGRDRFEAEIEIPPFRPGEVDVQVKEHDLFIHCVQDRAGTPLQILRTYKLPEDVDPASVKTSVEEDGILKVSASKGRRY